MATTGQGNTSIQAVPTTSKGLPAEVVFSVALYLLSVIVGNFWLNNLIDFGQPFGCLIALPFLIQREKGRSDRFYLFSDPRREISEANGRTRI
jgi:hypothetical protein